MHFVVVLVCAMAAMMAFCAVFQGFFLSRNKAWETAALLLICFTLFRPNFWMDRIAPATIAEPGAQIGRHVDALPAGAALKMTVATTDIAGDDVTKLVRLKLGDAGEARKRLHEAGVTLSSLSASPVITAVRPGSEAARLKLRQGDKIESVLVSTTRPNPFWFAVPAFALLALVALSQRSRRGRIAVPAPA